MRSVTASQYPKACASPARWAAPSICSSTSARFSRRHVLAGLGASALAGVVPPAFAAASPRQFEILRDGRLIGSHELTPSIEGDRVRMVIDIAIRVKILGITAYRYEHRNEELWEGGRVLSSDTVTNDDGEQAFCRVERQGDTLKIDGSGFSGEAPGNACPTSYWNYQNLQSDVWYSTQDGEVLSIQKARNTTEGGGERWDISGGVEVSLFYDRSREWRGSAFDAKGAEGTYRQTAAGGQFAALI
ncbi:MAG: DUF6134 family protein [Pseudomonadota bacterium]